VAENNPDGMGRPLPASDSQPVNAEEMLAELVRLVESSELAPKLSTPPAETRSGPNRPDTKPIKPLEMRSLHSSLEAPSSKPSETAAVALPRAPELDSPYSANRNGSDLASGRGYGARAFKVSALVLAGAVVIGSILWFERAEPGLPNSSALIATAQGPAIVQPRTNLTVATSSAAASASSRDITQSAQREVVSPEVRPTDSSARVSTNGSPPSADAGPTAIGVAQPTGDASGGKQPGALASTPPAAEPIAASQPMTSQSLDPKPAPTVSLPPDPIQVATPTPAATNSGVANQSSNAPLPPVRPAPKSAIEAAGVAQRSTPKLDLPTKLSSKSAARVVVARAEATGPTTPAAKTLKTAQTSTEAQTAPSLQPAPAPARPPNPNPVVHAFSNVMGALTSLIPFASH
jgi:hypothetical protein